MKIRRRETTGAFAAYGNVDSGDTLLKEKRNRVKREILCGSMKASGVMYDKSKTSREKAMSLLPPI